MRDKIIIISPHPDDETLGAGGFLLKSKAKDQKIYWLNMTNMKEEYGQTKKQIKKRSLEIEAVKKVYQFDGFFDFRLLSSKLKKQVIKTPLFLITVPGFSLLFTLVYKTTALTYNMGNQKLNYFLIKLGLWCSILAGYHKSK